MDAERVVKIRPTSAAHPLGTHCAPHRFRHGEAPDGKSLQHHAARLGDLAVMGAIAEVL